MTLYYLLFVYKQNLRKLWAVLTRFFVYFSVLMHDKRDHPKIATAHIIKYFLLYPSIRNRRPEPKTFRLVHLRAAALDKGNAQAELPRDFPDFLPGQDEGGDQLFM